MYPSHLMGYNFPVATARYELDRGNSSSSIDYTRRSSNCGRQAMKNSSDFLPSAKSRYLVCLARGNGLSICPVALLTHVSTAPLGRHGQDLAAQEFGMDIEE
jgi:hypothetical protein